MPDLLVISVSVSSFGAILWIEVLEHHPELIKGVQQLARILEPWGKLILTAPLGSGIHQDPYHYYGGYTPWWYKRFLVRRGLTRL